MRPMNTARAGGIAGALLIASLSTGAVPAQAQSDTQGTPVPFELRDAQLSFGQRATATGDVDRTLAGRTATLELRPAGQSAWSALGQATVGSDGRFRVSAPVPRSGALRVRVAGDGAPVATAASSSERPVRVSARLDVSQRRLAVTSGGRATVAGAVAPARAGLPVQLQVNRRGRWTTLGTARTGAGGRYRIADRRGSTMSAPARVRVGGAAGLAGAVRGVGRLEVFRRAHASWYGPGLYGNKLGCGGTLSPGTLGVAHKTLPCGTEVTFKKGSRSVRVRVIDRGPYVGGREYDLTAATAGRLGFRGHGPVLVTR